MARSSNQPCAVCVERPFKYQGSYFFHPDGWNPANPQIQLYLQSTDPPACAPNVTPSPNCADTDARYVLGLASHFRSLGATVSTDICSNCYLPRAVFHDEPRQKTFAAYPSSNGIVEFTPATVIPGANATNTQAFH